LQNFYLIWRFLMSVLKKKLLLIKPDYKYFPIGLAHVVRSLEQNGIEYDFIDTYYEKNSDIESLIKTGSYGAVASGGLIGDFTFYSKLFSRIKEFDPSIPCILGGNVTTDVRPEHIFDTMPVDFLVKGEGEITFPELLFALDQDKEVSEVDGILYKNNGVTINEIIKTKRRHFLDIQTTNWMPTWDFINPDRYGYVILPILTGRGCVGRCTFCSPTNGRFRARRLDYIFEEIEFLYSNYDFNHLVFMNEVFFPDEETIYKFCEEYKKIKPIRPWHCLLRVDVDPDILMVMKDAGCQLINVGIESGSNQVLKKIQKGFTVDDTRRFVEGAKKANIMLEGSFMMANYDENADDIKKTVDFMLETKVKGPMALTINYNGTLNYRRALKSGLITDEIEYIRSLEKVYGKSYYEVITGCMNGDLSYLNLSALPDQELYHTVSHEMRRYHTNGFNIRNVRFEPGVKKGEFKLTGNCPFCETELRTIDHMNLWNPFALLLNCTQCGAYPLFYDIRTTERYQIHYKKIIEKIQIAKRPVLIGYKTDIWFLLSFDLFNINYDSILGIVAHNQLPEGFSLTYPNLPIEKILEQNPDLIIVANDFPVDLERKIEEYTASQEADIVFIADIESGTSYRNLDFALYEYGHNIFNDHGIGRDYSLLLDHLKQSKIEEFWRDLPALDFTFNKSILSIDLPAEDLVEIDLFDDSFFGTGWGTAHRDRNETHWRWIGPTGLSFLYLKLSPDRTYQLKSLIHTAQGDTQTLLNLHVNGKPVTDVNICLEEGQHVFHNCVISPELIQSNNGWVKICYSINPPEDDLLPKQKVLIPTETRRFAFSRVICKQI
jgi:anaerobic magnesium-protoporphyrin IX monomethyl ester cyclase